MTRLKRFFSAILIIGSVAFFAGAEKLSSPTYNYTIDFPEGFILTKRNQAGTNYFFTHNDFEIYTSIKIFNIYEMDNAAQSLEIEVAKKTSNYDIDEFEWRNGFCAISPFQGSIQGTPFKGWGISSPLRNEKGFIVITSWCDARNFEKLENVILSSLDSLTIDYISNFQSGPVSTYDCPKAKEDVEVSFELDGHQITTHLDKNDREASEKLIQREYSVMELYASRADWQPAWKRYYRMIFRDSYSRLNRACFDIYTKLEPECEDQTDMAQRVLYWTQENDYQREQNDADFTSLPAMLYGEGSDCDSRSMFLSVFLHHMNLDTVIFISAKHSHAMAGFISDHPGRTFNVNGKKYLMGETTSKGLTWGKVAQGMENQGDWIPVSFEYGE